jgi:TPR repeat protein
LLGRIYVEDIDGFLGVDRNRGFQRLFEAERKGNEYAAYTLGKYYMEGKVVKKDIAKAIEYLEKASSKGNMIANYRLAEIYLFEADIFDIDKAIDYLNMSAQSGNEYARIALNRMAQNSLIALTTDILSIVGDLANLESQRKIEDATTMPKPRNVKKQKKSHEWEMSM